MPRHVSFFFRTEPSSIPRQEPLSFVTGQGSVAQHDSTVLTVHEDSGEGLPARIVQPIPNDSGSASRKPGKSPYRWSASALRKVLRILHILPFNYGEVAEDLEKAGAPRQQTTTKALRAASGGTPCKELLKGTERRDIRRKLIYGDHTDRAKADPEIFTTLPTSLPADSPEIFDVDYDSEPDDVGAWLNEGMMAQQPDVAADTIQDPTAQATLPVKGGICLPESSKRKRSQSEDRPPDGRNDSAKQASGHKRGARVSASQIDFEELAKLLADRQKEGVTEDVINHIIKRWSRCASSDSSQSIQDFIARPGSRLEPPIGYHAYGGPICSHLLSSPLLLGQLDPKTSEGLHRRLDEHAEGVATYVYEWIRSGNSAVEVTESGETALHLAVRLGYKAVCAILLWEGAGCRDAALDTGYKGFKSLLRGAHEPTRDTQSAVSIVQYTRMLSCLAHVACALAEPVARNETPLRLLFDQCQTLDPHSERCATRLSEYNERKQSQSSYLPRHKRQSFATSFQSPTSIDSGYAGTPEGQAGSTRHMSLNLGISTPYAASSKDHHLFGGEPGLNSQLLPVSNVTSTPSGNATRLSSTAIEPSTDLRLSDTALTSDVQHGLHSFQTSYSGPHISGNLEQTLSFEPLAQQDSLVSALGLGEIDDSRDQSYHLYDGPGDYYSYSSMPADSLASISAGSMAPPQQQSETFASYSYAVAPTQTLSQDNLFKVSAAHTNQVVASSDMHVQPTRIGVPAYPNPSDQTAVPYNSHAIRYLPPSVSRSKSIVQRQIQLLEARVRKETQMSDKSAFEAARYQSAATHRTNEAARHEHEAARARMELSQLLGTVS